LISAALEQLRATVAGTLPWVTPEAPALLTQMSSVPRPKASSRRALDVGELTGVAATSGCRNPFRMQPLDGGRDVDARPGRQPHRRAPLPQQPGHGKPQAACRASHDRHASAENVSLRTHASLIRAAAGESRAPAWRTSSIHLVAPQSLRACLHGGAVLFAPDFLA
jgi:hypothetical protein